MEEHTAQYRVRRNVIILRGVVLQWPVSDGCSETLVATRICCVTVYCHLATTGDSQSALMVYIIIMTERERK